MAKTEQPRTALPPAPQRFRRSDATAVAQRRLLAVGVALAVAGWLAALWFMSSVPFTGDEAFYADNGKAIADFLTGREGALEPLQKRLVNYGWFMPGASLLLTPLYVVQPEPTVATVRAFASVVYVLLWVCAMRETARTFGRAAAAAFLLFPTLAAMWLLFSTTVWGDLPAGLVLAIAVARTYRLAVAMLERQAVRLVDIVVLELLLAAMVYLRANTIIVVVAIHALLVGIAVLSWQWQQLLRRAALLAAGAAVFASLVAPWSNLASRELGDRVITTSSAPLSLGITFGNKDEICFGPCRTDAVWYWAVRYSRRYGRENGISQLEAQRQMSAYARRNLTLDGYLAQTRENFRSYITPTGRGPRRGLPFVDRFAARSTREISPASARAIKTFVDVQTLLLYVPFFLALVTANLAIVRRDQRLQVLSLCLKAVTISLFLQPFVHQSHSRYWSAYAPIMAFAAMFLASWWSSRPSTATAAAASAGAASLPLAEHDVDVGDRPRVIMMWLQAAYVAAILLVALVVTFG